MVFFGAAPCCAGLQINVMLPDSLAGAGRVPIVVASGGHASNAVRVVHCRQLMQHSSPAENQTRSRELASTATPGTSLVLSADEW